MNGWQTQSHLVRLLNPELPFREIQGNRIKKLILLKLLLFRQCGEQHSGLFYCCGMRR